MPKKFTMEDVQKQIDEILDPPVGSTALQRLKEAARTRTRPSAPSIAPFPATSRIGGAPASAGYHWYPERDGWMRPWDETTFIPRRQKPEWDEFIAREYPTGYRPPPWKPGEPGITRERPPKKEEPLRPVPSPVRPIIGGAPWTAGYMWNEELQGWWKGTKESLIKKPEWDRYIPKRK